MTARLPGARLHSQVLRAEAQEGPRARRRAQRLHAQHRRHLLLALAAARLHERARIGSALWAAHPCARIGFALCAVHPCARHQIQRKQHQTQTTFVTSAWRASLDLFVSKTGRCH